MRRDRRRGPLRPGTSRSIGGPLDAPDEFRHLSRAPASATPSNSAFSTITGSHRPGGGNSCPLLSQWIATSPWRSSAATAGRQLRGRPRRLPHPPSRRGLRTYGRQRRRQDLRARTGRRPGHRRRRLGPHPRRESAHRARPGPGTHRRAAAVQRTTWRPHGRREAAHLGAHPYTPGRRGAYRRRTVTVSMGRGPCRYGSSARRRRASPRCGTGTARERNRSHHARSCQRTLGSRAEEMGAPTWVGALQLCLRTGLLEAVPFRALPCPEHRPKPVVSGQHGSAPLRYGRSSAARLSCANGHLGWSRHGAGDRDRTGMASLEGAGSRRTSLLVRRLQGHGACLLRALEFSGRWVVCGRRQSGFVSLSVRTLSAALLQVAHLARIRQTISDSAGCLVLQVWLDHPERRQTLRPMSLGPPPPASRPARGSTSRWGRGGRLHGPASRPERASGSAVLR
ncbi:hypothetical protein JD79_04396 [Geodermatophilus normandii]|uniref:Uncharacterized protein n=1 Tax=Geodermatophilus normandii TaxID=1137989 RepID=A0A317QNU5_9ACTN|nr:hypothetical protein JD79_04396 [Geodermatophilus normandii]